MQQRRQTRKRKRKRNADATQRNANATQRNANANANASTSATSSSFAPRVRPLLRRRACDQLPGGTWKRATCIPRHALTRCCSRVTRTLQHKLPPCIQALEYSKCVMGLCTHVHSAAKPGNIMPASVSPQTRRTHVTCTVTLVQCSRSLRVAGTPAAGMPLCAGWRWQPHAERSMPRKAGNHGHRRMCCSPLATRARKISASNSRRADEGVRLSAVERGDDAVTNDA